MVKVEEKGRQWLMFMALLSMERKTETRREFKGRKKKYLCFT